MDNGKREMTTSGITLMINSKDIIQLRELLNTTINKLITDITNNTNRYMLTKNSYQKYIMLELQDIDKVNRFL